MLTILVLLIIAWVGVGTQFVLQRRREGRAESSVAFFRQQLSTLERATPGSTMRKSVTGPVPVVQMDDGAAGSRPVAETRVVDMRRRRRDVLMGLAGASGLSLMLRLVAPGAVTTMLLLLCLTALGAYIWALRQRQLAVQARSASLGAPVVRTVRGSESAGTVEEPSSESVRVTLGAVNATAHRSTSSAS